MGVEHGQFIEFHVTINSNFPSKHANTFLHIVYVCRMCMCARPNLSLSSTSRLTSYLDHTFDYLQPFEIVRRV